MLNFPVALGFPVNLARTFGADLLFRYQLRLPFRRLFRQAFDLTRVIGQQLTAESELARTPGIRLSN